MARAGERHDGERFERFCYIACDPDDASTSTTMITFNGCLHIMIDGPADERSHGMANVSTTLMVFLPKLLRR
jgi:hypothetical protein